MVLQIFENNKSGLLINRVVERFENWGERAEDDRQNCRRASLLASSTGLGRKNKQEEGAR